MYRNHFMYTPDIHHNDIWYFLIEKVKKKKNNRVVITLHYVVFSILNMILNFSVKTQ